MASTFACPPYPADYGPAADDTQRVSGHPHSRTSYCQERLMRCMGFHPRGTLLPFSAQIQSFHRQSLTQTYGQSSADTRKT